MGGTSVLHESPAGIPGEPRDPHGWLPAGVWKRQSRTRVIPSGSSLSRPPRVSRDARDFVIVVETVDG